MLVLLLVLVLVAHFVRGPACALTFCTFVGSKIPNILEMRVSDFSVCQLHFLFSCRRTCAILCTTSTYCPIYTDHCAISTSPANRLNCVEEEIAHSVEILRRWDLYGDKGTVNLASCSTAQCLPVLPTRHSVNETYDASPPWLRCSARSLGK